MNGRISKLIRQRIFGKGNFERFEMRPVLRNQFVNEKKEVLGTFDQMGTHPKMRYYRAAKKTYLRSGILPRPIREVVEEFHKKEEEAKHQNQASTSQIGDSNANA